MAKRKPCKPKPKVSLVDVALAQYKAAVLQAEREFHRATHFIGKPVPKPGLANPAQVLTPVHIK